MEHRIPDHATSPSAPTPEPVVKRKWRAPEIVEVGGVLDLTEAVGGTLSDSGGASPPSYFADK